MAYVVVRDQNGKVSRKAELKRAVVVGRSRSCDLCVRDVKVSREHCEVERRGEDWVVGDLESRNGTYVNGNKISEYVLRDGDVIEVGKIRIAFYAGEMARSRALDPVMAGLVDAEEAVGRALQEQRESGDVGSGSSLFATRVMAEGVTADESTISGAQGVPQIRTLADGKPAAVTKGGVAVSPSKRNGYIDMRKSGKWLVGAAGAGVAAVAAWLHWG